MRRDVGAQTVGSEALAGGGAARWLGWGRRHGSALLLGFVAAVVLAAAACGGLTVGRFQERSGDLAQAPLRSLQLTLVSSYAANDSPAPSWSPDGTRFVYAEQYMSRIMVFDLGTQGASVVYDANTAPSTVADLRYNVDSPRFLDDSRILSGPSWPGALSDTSPWSNSMVTSTTGAAPTPFSPGYHAQVNPVDGRVLLEGSDGLRLTDSNGVQLELYPYHCNARWAPDGKRFAAIQYDSYCGENGRLVVISEDATSELIERNVAQLCWHPRGLGIGFVRPAGTAYSYSYGYDFGTLWYRELGAEGAKQLAERARNPVFVAKLEYLVFESPDGLGMSDLQDKRIFREINISNPAPSPDGSKLVGVSSSYTQGYYYAMMNIVLYELSVGR